MMTEIKMAPRKSCDVKTNEVEMNGVADNCRETNPAEISLLTDHVVSEKKRETDIPKYRRLKTIQMFIAFFGLGLCLAIIGPSLLDLKIQVDVNLQQITYVFIARSGGYVVGSIIGGICFDRFENQLLLGLCTFFTAITGLFVPFCSTLALLTVVLISWGFCSGFLDLGGNVVCVNLWGKESGPWMQALHFFFAFGSTVAPLIAAPFLTASSEAGMLLNGTVTPAPTTIPTTSLVLIASNTSEVVYVQQSTGVMYGSNHQSKRDTDMAKFSMLLDEMIERIERSITDDIPHGKPSMLTTTNSTGGSVVYLKQSTEFPEEAMSEEHAEDGEIQFTDVYDGWNDTHAGNEDDIAINRSTLIVPYTIVAIFNLLASLPFFFFYCIGSQPCLLKKEANNEATADHVENENETIVFRVTLLFLLFLFTFVYVGHESAYGGFVYTFAMKSDLDFNAQFASYLNSAFWGSFALSRAMAIGVAMFMTPRAMLIADLCGLCVASSLLAAFGDQNMYILWGASILLGISMGSVFPSGLAWAERYIELTGKATSVFVIGAASSEMAFPWLLGYLIKTFSVSTLMYVILSLSLSTTIVYIIMQIIASKKGERVTKDVHSEINSIA